MHSAKDEPVISLSEQPKMEKEYEEPSSVPVKYRGTAHDKKDMNMMGKKQVLRVCVISRRSRQRLSRYEMDAFALH